MEEIRDCLIVIDMQNDFIDGVLANPYAKAIVPNVSKKILQYIRNNKPVFATMDTHFEDLYNDTVEGKSIPLHCVYGTHGWQMPYEVNFDESITKIIKNTFGVIEWSNFYLQHVKSVELCGVCTDICVVSNALILRSRYPNVEIYVDSESCAGTTTGKHHAALEVMKSCGVHVYESK